MLFFICFLLVYKIASYVLFCSIYALIFCSLVNSITFSLLKFMFNPFFQLGFYEVDCFGVICLATLRLLSCYWMFFGGNNPLWYGTYCLQEIISCHG